MHRLLLILFVLCIACSGACGEDAAPGPEEIADRLGSLERTLPALRAKIDQVKARGQDVSYPMVTYTVLENFIGYAREDAGKGEVKRAAMQLWDLEAMAPRLDRELSEALDGKRRLPSVPRWTGDTRPVVRSSSFVAPTTTPGKAGRETRPVFFTGYGHFAQIRADLEKFPNYGINMMQIEIGPWSIFPEEGKVEDAPIRGLLSLLDRARDAGVVVNLLISPHYFPEWMMRKYPDLRKKREYFLPYCLHASESQELLKRYISILIPPLKDHPALHSICVSNEPRNVEEPCKPGARDWRAWLEARHGSIATLNSRWGTSHASFEEIELPDPFDASTVKPAGRWADFIRWNQEFFAGWHKMLVDAVRAAAPDLPVHSKIQSYTLVCSLNAKVGNDAYLLGRLFDINGNDGGIVYTFGQGPYSQIWTTNLSSYDLQRSVKDAPIYNSENHLINDRDTRYIPEEHIRAALWQQAVHGQSATTIWVWERTFDPKSDFAGSIMHRPACARAVGIVNHDLNRAAEEVTALQQAPARVLILHNTSAMTQGDGDYDTCVKRLYAALSFCGIKAGFVTEWQLEDGLVPDAPVVCIPGAKYISDAAFRALRKYKGHMLVIGSDMLQCDQYGKERPERLAADSVPYDDDKTTAFVLTRLVRPKLWGWNVRSRVELVDPQGKPVWGVAWREADTAGGTLVNLCNYDHTPISLKLFRKGRAVRAVDVLTGEPVTGMMELQPLEVRLLRVAD